MNHEPRNPWLRTWVRLSFQTAWLASEEARP